MDRQEYVQRIVDEENDRRERTYRGQTADWTEVARRDLDLNIPIRPFPVCPGSKVVGRDEEGQATDLESINPVIESFFQMEPHKDGFYRLKTPLPVRRQDRL